MPADIARRHQWWIDHLNGITDPAIQLTEAQRWARAELAKVGHARAGDLAGWQRMLTASIVGVLLQMPRHRPAPEYAAGWPQLGGGGWSPAPYGDGRAAVERP